MNIVEENWEQILNKMKLEYCSSNISYNTWIAPLTVYEVTDDTVYILVNYVPAWSTLKKNTCFLLKYVLQKSQDTNMKSLS